MAIGLTRMTGGTTGVDATSFTRTYTATAGVLAIAVIGVERDGSTNPATPTVTHNSITATEITSLLYITTGGTRHKVFVFAWNTGAGSASVALTADFAGVTHSGWENGIYEVTGSDVANGVSQCFVQTVPTAADLSGTSGSITLAAAADSNNRPFAVWCHGAVEVTTIGGSWTGLTPEVSHSNPVASMEAAWRSAAFDTAAAASWATSSPYGGIAMELKVAGGGGGGGVSVDPFGMAGFFGG